MENPLVCLPNDSGTKDQKSLDRKKSPKHKKGPKIKGLK